MLWIVLLLASHEIKCFPIWGEDRGVLAPVGTGNESVGKDGVGLGMIDEDVAGKVEHFDALVGHYMKTLSGGVGGKSAVFTRWVPIGIDHRTAKRFVRCLEDFALAVDLHDGSSVFSTHMKYHLFGVGA